MHNFPQKLYRAIVRCEEICSKALLIIIVLFTFFSAVARYFSISWVWSLDLILLLFAWFAFLASSQAIRRRSIVNMPILVERLPKKAQQVIAVFNDLLMVAFMVTIIGYTIYISILNWRQRITSMGISYSWILLALAAGGVLMTLGLVLQLAEHLQVLFGRKKTSGFELYPQKKEDDPV